MLAAIRTSIRCWWSLRVAWAWRCLGAVNGVLVAYGRVPAIIVTLGTLAIFRTLLVDYSGAQLDHDDRSLPRWLVDLPQLPICFRSAVSSCA